MLKKLLTLYGKNPLFKQALILYSVNIIGIPLSVVTSVIITRFLGPSSYGDFKFLFNIFNLAIVFFSFGLFQAGNRALVLNRYKQKAREFYGAELIVVIVLFLFMSFFLLLYGQFDRNINEKGLKTVFTILIPFSWIFLLVHYFEVLFQADNKIQLLAKSRLFPQAAFFCSVVVIYFLFHDYSANKLLLVFSLFLFTQILVFIYILKKVNPSLKNLKIRVKQILKFNKSYGFNVYLGSIFAVGLSQLTGVLISYFANNNKGVGYFSLAMTIAGPLSFIPNVIATTHYKEFSNKSKISSKLQITTLVITFFALILILVLVNPFIQFFYGDKFKPVIPLTYIVSFGIILNGLADFLNRFLGSHGKGKELRNSSIIVGICLLILNLIFIPTYGETGAAYTLLLSGFIYLMCMIWFYKKLIRQLIKN